MANIFDWSATPSANTSIDSINCNTGMTPANVDNLFRSIAAAIRNSFASALQNFLAGTAALPQANGGTGATDAPSARIALGCLSSDYNRLQILNKSASFSPGVQESGMAYNYIGSAGATMTLQPNATVALTPGDTFVVRSAAVPLSIARGSGVTLNVNGSTSSSNATLAAGGIATVSYWGVETWSINGVGVS